MKLIIVAAVVWVAASFLLGIVVGKWIAGPTEVDECPCGSCVLGREVGE